MSKPVLFLICIFFISLTVACSPNREPIRVGVNAWPPCELWSIAREQGFFEDLNVEVVRFSTWTDNMKALPLGNIDVTHSTYFNALYFYDKGNLGKIIHKSDTIEGGDGLAISNEIRGVEDLAGKRIAVETATDEHFLLYKALERYGLSESDVVLVSASSVDAAKLFIDRQVDACFTYEPYLSQAAAGRPGKIVFTTREIPDTMIDCLVASSEIISKRPEDLRKLLRAFLKAQEWVKANPERAYIIMASDMGMKKEDFAPFYESFRFFSRDESQREMESAAFRSVLTDMRGFLEKRNLVTWKADVSEVIWNPWK